MPETSYHTRLKKYAKIILQKKGVNSIKEEYAILLYGKKYIVDVVGFLPDGKIIAVECGATTLPKVNELKKHFKEVIQLTLLDLLEYLESRVRELEKQRKQIRKIVKIKVIGLSKLFQRGKTQVPSEIRKQLQIKDDDKLLWISEDGKIIVERA